MLQLCFFLITYSYAYGSMVVSFLPLFFQILEVGVSVLASCRRLSSVVGRKEGLVEVHMTE